MYAIRLKNSSNSVGIYVLKVGNRSTETRCEICSKLTVQTPERRQWRSIFLHIVLVFLLLIKNHTPLVLDKLCWKNKKYSNSCVLKNSDACGPISDEKMLLLKLSFLSTEVRKVLMNIDCENTTTIWERG